jgi:hypothetical protein
MNIESLLSGWDGEMVVTHHDRSTGAFICIAIHSSRLGPATGGTRMKAYPDLAAALGDALRLSAAMTRKFAVPGMPRGGGKAVIALPRDFDQRARAPIERPLLHRTRRRHDQRRHGYRRRNRRAVCLRPHAVCRRHGKQWANHGTGSLRRHPGGR